MREAIPAPALHVVGIQIAEKHAGRVTPNVLLVLFLKMALFRRLKFDGFILNIRNFSALRYPEFQLQVSLWGWHSSDKRAAALHLILYFSGVIPNAGCD